MRNLTLALALIAGSIASPSVAQASETASARPLVRRDQPLAYRLADAASAAPSAVKEDGSLYGVQRWNAATGRSYLGLRFPGLLSCAYTVSAILREAGHPIGNRASVSAVDSALSAWPKIRKTEDLKPGDVVFWKPRTSVALGLKCPSDHWHVGVAIGDGKTVDNDWWSGKPVTGSIDRLCVAFAYARRAPDNVR
ncbi:hypothetical protein [Burkholderia ubonensis]|uniref:hypothetical protein n=1 Tax=Burkholderia ubonensis TaxID=101571 RepID=UPI000AF745CE|nr:hypothetical protein [Burkholderia ubonensis]